MKKLSLALATIITLAASICLVSCKKETPVALIVPAVQKIREVVNKAEWKVSDKMMMQMEVSLSQKIKDEFQAYATDSNIVAVCRVKFKDDPVERVLPYVIPGFGGTKYYFHSLSGGKIKIHFVNSMISDFSAGGSSGALPLEEVSMNFTKVEW